MIFIFYKAESVFAKYTVIVNNARTEYQINPIGIGNQNPRLSWEIIADGKNVFQTAYYIRAAKNAEGLKKGTNLVWDT